MFYETIDDDDYSKNMLYSLTKVFPYPPKAPVIMPSVCPLNVSAIFSEEQIPTGELNCLCTTVAVPSPPPGGTPPPPALPGNGLAATLCELPAWLNCCWKAMLRMAQGLHESISETKLRKLDIFVLEHVILSLTYRMMVTRIWIDHSFKI